MDGTLLNRSNADYPDRTSPASARVAASEALLNRAWGRPSLAISAEGEAEPVELIVRWAGP